MSKIWLWIVSNIPALLRLHELILQYRPHSEMLALCYKRGEALHYRFYRIRGCTISPHKKLWEDRYLHMSKISISCEVIHKKSPIIKLSLKHFNFISGSNLPIRSYKLLENWSDMSCSTSSTLLELGGGGGVWSITPKWQPIFSGNFVIFSKNV